MLFLFLSIFISLSSLDQKVIICGVAKDVAKALPNMIQMIEEMGGLFADYRVIVYENDSKDGSPELLAEWAKDNSKVFVRSEKLSHVDYVNFTWDHFGYRPEKIAHARNIVLDYALSDSYVDFPYLIWIDMDFEKPFSFEGIVEVFESTTPWDAVFANGVHGRKGYYFDWYPFRDKERPFGAELLSDWWWHHLPKKFRFDPKSPWYPVYSAFGGLGIYKKSSIQNCRYTAFVTPDLQAFAEKFIKENPKHPIVKTYHRHNKKLFHLLRIPAPTPNLSHIAHEKTGILLDSTHTPIIWRMNSGVNQYPSTCEHVPFHASMIAHGHDKLFINPHLLLPYDSR